jgi:hypothetical protein
MDALLTNASATGASATWPGGEGLFALAGTVSGATVTLQVLGPDGTTYLSAVKKDGTTAAALTAVGCLVVELPPGRVRALVASGTPSGLYATLTRIPR